MFVLHTGMPAKSDNPRIAVNNFRTTPAEQSQLRQVAAQKGVTVSDLIRRGLVAQGALPKQ